MIFFVAIIAAAGYFGYKYLQEEDCVKSPYTNECVNTSTGYEAPTYGGGGDNGGNGDVRISGADNDGGGAGGIEIQVP